MSKEHYFHYMSHVAEQVFREYDQKLDAAKLKWRETGAYYPFYYLAYYANLESAIFSITKQKKYADRAIKALSDLSFCVNQESRNGEAPPIILDSLFGPGNYMSAYLRLKDFLNKNLIDAIETNVATVLNSYAGHPEWGTHNRAVERACSLLKGAQLFPRNQSASFWKTLGENIMEENYGKWSIEDSGTYSPIWFHSLICYAEANGKEDFFSLPQTIYYFRYFAELICPLGVIPDFGDARWGTSWTTVLSILEKGAAKYQDGKMKNKAVKMFEALSKLDPGTSPLSLKGIRGIIDAYFWSDETVSELLDTKAESREVLDDIIGKKIIFENQDAYLLLNYRDEGDFGSLQRNYLKTTIPVEAEKPHHGHADVNSIICLTSGSSVLLHDGGYRDGYTTSGQYRADFYHNTVVMRNGCPTPGENYFEFIQNEEKYHSVRSEKIYFYKMQELDVSRTRVVDELRGLCWDRNIVFFLKCNAFLVVDFLKAHTAGYRTIGVQYFTRILSDIGEKTFRARLDYLGSDEFLSEIPNGAERSLVIHFPDGGKPVGKGAIRRSYTEEQCVYQYFSGKMDRADTISFASILIPNDGGLKEKSICSSMIENDNSTYIKFGLAGDTYELLFMHDIYAHIQLTDKRPQYEAGTRLQSGGCISSDGIFAYTSDARWGMVCGTKFLFHDKIIFDAPCGDFLDNKLNLTKGKSWWNSWEDAVKITN